MLDVKVLFLLLYIGFFDKNCEKINLKSYILINKS